jgi:alpha-beta hydrolase superfamily lysophospholipase
MKKPVCLAISIFLLAVLPAEAQEVSGTYLTYVAGQTITETYTVSVEPDGALKAEAEITIQGSKRKVVTRVAGAKPVSFLVEIGGARHIAAEFSGATAKGAIGGQPFQKEIQSTVILENLVWHHYLFLLRQYDATKGGTQNFKFFLPSLSTESGLRVERPEAQNFNVAGKAIATRRYHMVSSSGTIIDLWADEKLVPQLILIEAQGLKVIHQGSEALAEAILAERARAAGAPGFLSEEVSIQNGEVTLAGALTIPQNGKSRHPAAVLITGSGGQDRDGNPGGSSLLRLIAERLSANGIAVLRHDDRGVGKSSMPTKATTYQSLIGDTRAAIEYLRNRKEIDPARVILVGHSEGGYTARIIAAEDERIAGIALLAGASLATLEKLVLEQALYQAALSKAVDPGNREQLVELARFIMDSIEKAKTGAQDQKLTDTFEYFRQHIALDMAANTKRLRCPVLILQGERDNNVLASHAVETALALSAAGNKQIRLRIFPNLNHTFTPAFASKDEERKQLSVEMLETLQKWMAELVTGDGK